jgi:DNA-binding FadR family transcriptional regulator
MPEDQRLYERLAQAITAAIARGDYPVGQRLPSERELARSFNVSRATVREATIALELDGLVEARIGSGVYVTNSTAPRGAVGARGVGPFELLEARRAIEAETCAMAATRITDAQLGELNELIAEMRSENERNVELSEAADRRFHELIATATENSGMLAVVQMLWETRTHSPQTQSMDAKVRALGIKPHIEQHTAILKALKRRDPDAARSAMRTHLTRVLAATFRTTETEELEKARSRLSDDAPVAAFARRS